MNPLDLLEKVEDQLFENATIALDGRRFTKCNFVTCRLIYMGGLFDFVDCHFDFSKGGKLLPLGPLGMAVAEANAEDVKAALLNGLTTLLEKLKGPPGIDEDGSFRY